jgi:hypothetical protein
MVRTVFAVAIVALAFASVSGVSHAAPVAPLPSGVASDAASGNIRTCGAAGATATTITAAGIVAS